MALTLGGHISQVPQTILIYFQFVGSGLTFWATENSSAPSSIWQPFEYLKMVTISFGGCREHGKRYPQLLSVIIQL